MLHNFLDYILSLSLSIRALLCVATLAFLIFLYFYLYRYLRLVLYKGVKCSEVEPVSLVVVLNGELEFLQERIELLFAQDYPAPFQVVIVNCNHKQDDVQFALNQLQIKHDNLYITNLESSHRYTSKLTYTLGVKGAKYPNVIFVPTNVKVSSLKWLYKMACGFVPNKMVTGLSVFTNATGFKGGIIRVHHLQSQLLFLSSALLGSPFKGDKYNMGFNGSVFLNSGGISQHLRLNCGEDDLLVQAAAPYGGMSVVLEPESVVEVDCEEDWQSYSVLRSISCFSKRYYAKRYIFLLFTELAYKFLFWISLFLLLIISPQVVQITMLGVAVLWNLIMLFVLWMFGRRTKISIPYFRYLLYDIYSPLDNLYLWFVNRVKPNKQVWI